MNQSATPFPKRWTKAYESAALIALVGLLGVGCSRPTAVQKQPAADSQSENEAAAQPDEGGTAKMVSSAEEGSQLYLRHCAACHGEKGDGQGIAAKFVFPKPRDFRAGRFRLVNTANGIPSNADLEAVLKRGMPGSAMLPWAHLGDEAVGLLVKQVRQFHREGIRDQELRIAAEDDEELSEDELQEITDRLTTPGPLLEAPEMGGASAAAVGRGKQLYLKREIGCIGCHGEQGKGDGQTTMVDAEGLPTRPRDLTAGFFKGDPGPASVFRRILTGMPGSPMPAAQGLSADQVADLTHFVLSLSDEATREATVLKRLQLTAVHVAGLPSAGDSSEWEAIEPVALRTTSLWWRDDADPGLTVQAVHDGESIAMRLHWRDEQADLHAARSESFEDAVAIELYRGDAEPFVGMGAMNAAVDVWLWDADRQGSPDVEDVNPRLVVDSYPFSEVAAATAEYQDRDGTKTENQPDVSLPARASGNQIRSAGSGSGASSLTTGGPGSSTFRLPTSQKSVAHGTWSEGRWTVVLTRALAVAGPGDGVMLEPGAKVSVAFAVWDGAHRERDGNKSITVWQDLILED